MVEFGKPVYYLARYLQTNRYLRRLKVWETVIGWPCRSTASVYFYFWVLNCHLMVQV